MATIIDPDFLHQGAATNSTGVTVGAPTGRQCTITSAATLPLVNAGDYFEIRNSPDGVNNGLWVEDGGSPTTSSITATKVSGSDPIAGGPDTVDFLGNTTTVKNIFYDTAGYGVYLLEKNGLSADGAIGQAIYSHMMIVWRTDAFLGKNAPFPMFMVDADAGKALMGVDAAGNRSGWNWVDNATHSIRTRKLIRNLGWAEVDALGVTQAVHFGCITLGAFEDETPITGDFAYFQFGDDTTVDDTVDFTFAGSVNEAVQCFEKLAIGAINSGSGVTISTDGRTMTRSDGGNWRADGFIAGGQIQLYDSENATSDGSSFLLSAVGSGVDGSITVGTAADAGTGFSFIDGGGGNDSILRIDGGSWETEGYTAGGVVVVANATTGANDGTFTILAISTTTTAKDTLEVATASLTADTADNTATFGPLDPTGSPDTTVNAAVDNRNAVTLRNRNRDADPNGKTYAQANLASAGKTVLGNLVFSFPLGNATDLKISDTDAFIDGNAPYTGMTLSVHATAQSLGGAGVLVGGPYNFGFTLNANGGTKDQVYQWAQRQIRKLTDIDNDGDVAIGRAIDGLMRFVGDKLEVGIVAGGALPNNPQGGGSGVFVSNLAAASKNTTTMRDNSAVERGFPIGTPITLVFNQTIKDDTLSTYTLCYDWTIRTTVSDLVVNAGTGANGTITSAGSNLPASLDVGVGAYIRVPDLAGVDAAMNGVYQVTSISAASYNVTRHDGADIVTTSSASAFVDEHPFDSPDAIVVKDDTNTDVDGLASADFSFTYAYSTNVQGGRTASTDASVVCRSIGQDVSQFAQSTVQVVESATPLNIPVSAQDERNFRNPS